jgi:serine/threonine-protein kinase HipA
LNAGVFYRGAPLGRLSSEKARLHFAYGAEAVADQEPALSVRLPPAGAPYEHEAASPYFANLLPEDEYRRLLARTLGISERNVAGLLGAIGGECAGAVAIWPDDEHPPLDPEYVPLGDAGARRLFEATDALARMRIVREGRLSLAGGMEKLGLRLREGQWLRGRAGAPTTHILKWAPPELPDLNFNELFCLELLRAALLPVAEAFLVGGGTPVLAVVRFDRRIHSDDTVDAIHQEDFCQALGVEPESKYQADGGPDFAQCAEVIRRHCAVPARELGQLLRWAIANYLVGNGDAHGKNLALLYAPDGLRLAPFYDVASTLAYDGLSRKLAMAIGGEYRFAWVHGRHWARLLESLALPPGLIVREGLELAARFEAALPSVRERLSAEHGDQPIFRTVAEVVAQQVARLREQLAASREDGHTEA